MVSDTNQIISNVVASQVDDHSEYGGVVPEIACRKHIENVIGVIRRALSQATCGLSDLSAIAVTQGPGLVGALLVGIGAAKGIAYSSGLPLIAVNHLEGHILSAFLGRDLDLGFPFVSLVVSGGHTSLYLVKALGDYTLVGRTVDDAAGEAFDKVAKVLGLGYPGGPVIESLANEAGARQTDFPSPMIKQDNYDFSFSGLKTAVLNYLCFELGASSPDEMRDRVSPEQLRAICAGFQKAAFEVLVAKTVRLAKEEHVGAIVLGGGVSANATLRAVLTESALEAGIRVLFPPLGLSTDNAAMIALAAHHRLEKRVFAGPDLDADPRLAL